MCDRLHSWCQCEVMLEVLYSFFFPVLSIAIYIYKRVEMVQELSALAGVPFEDMLVHNIQEANIKGRDCLTASLWITGENGA